MDRLQFKESVTWGKGPIMVPDRGIVSADALALRGSFHLEHLDVNGKPKGWYTMANTVVNAGKNLLLDVMFDAGSQVSTWYMSLIQDGGYSAIAAGDTMGSHAGWQEFTGYDETTRPIWNPDAAASESITNSTTTDFTINTSDTLKGIFIVADNTISGTTGTLWCATLFSADVPVTNGETFRLTYTLSV